LYDLCVTDDELYSQLYKARPMYRHEADQPQHGQPGSHTTSKGDRNDARLHTLPSNHSTGVGERNEARQPQLAQADTGTTGIGDRNDARLQVFGEYGCHSNGIGDRYKAGQPQLAQTGSYSTGTGERHEERLHNLVKHGSFQQCTKVNSETVSPYFSRSEISTPDNAQSLTALSFQNNGFSRAQPFSQSYYLDNSQRLDLHSEDGCSYKVDPGDSRNMTSGIQLYRSRVTTQDCSGPYENQCKDVSPKNNNLEEIHLHKESTSKHKRNEISISSKTILDRIHMPDLENSDILSSRKVLKVKEGKDSKLSGAAPLSKWQLFTHSQSSEEIDLTEETHETCGQNRDFSVIEKPDGLFSTKSFDTQVENVNVKQPFLTVSKNFSPVLKNNNNFSPLIENHMNFSPVQSAKSTDRFSVIKNSYTNTQETFASMDSFDQLMADDDWELEAGCQGNTVSGCHGDQQVPDNNSGSVTNTDDASGQPDSVGKVDAVTEKSSKNSPELLKDKSSQSHENLNCQIECETIEPRAQHKMKVDVECDRENNTIALEDNINTENSGIDDDASVVDNEAESNSQTGIQNLPSGIVAEKTLPLPSSRQEHGIELSEVDSEDKEKLPVENSRLSQEELAFKPLFETSFDMSLSFDEDDHHSPAKQSDHDTCSEKVVEESQTASSIEPSSKPLFETSLDLSLSFGENDTEDQSCKDVAADMMSENASVNNKPSFVKKITKKPVFETSFSLSQAIDDSDTVTVSSSQNTNKDNIPTKTKPSLRISQNTNKDNIPTKTKPSLRISQNTNKDNIPTKTKPSLRIGWRPPVKSHPVQHSKEIATVSTSPIKPTSKCLQLLAKARAVKPQAGVSETEMVSQFSHQRSMNSVMIHPQTITKTQASKTDNLRCDSVVNDTDSSSSGCLSLPDDFVKKGAPTFPCMRKMAPDSTAQNSNGSNGPNKR